MGRGRARGHRQRAAQRQAAATHSQLFKYLAEMWAWGTFSAVVVQTIAAKVVADHSTAGIADSPQDVQSLAALGSIGRGPQHCHAQLVNLVITGFTFAVTSSVCPM